MVSESTLTLDILPLSADTARLVRVYGTEPCIALPGTLPAPEGGSFAVTELGDYCFSEKPRSLPAADKTCRYEAAPDGTARLIRAFGQTVGGTCRRYDFDFDAPAAGSDADDLHPVCGNFLEELTLPDSLQVVGSCAFYNCRKPRLLTVGTGSLTVGSDVFLNCFALETIRVQAGPETHRSVCSCEQHHRGRAGGVLACRCRRAAGGALVSRLLGGHRGDSRPHPAAYLFRAGIPLPAVFSQTIYSCPQNTTRFSRRATMPTMPM
ncbi:MAG: leucine-rich repeat protein [Faecalibacterium sp.]